MTDDTKPPYDPRVLRTGSRLREYIIERVLGKGGFGVTYLARHQHLSNMLMAIKEYMPADQVYRDDRSMVHVHSEAHRSDFEYGMKRFINEAKSLHDLGQQRHPSLINIVQVKGFFHENGTAYMVMEYVSGDSLEDVIEQLGKTGKKLSEEQLKAVFKQLAEAISFVHSRDLLHRDITPSNIILRERAIGGGDVDDFQPVMIDFGSAKVSVAQTMATKRTNSQFTMAVYTPSYAPLEQCDGMDQDHRTDIYGLASTMYHLTLRRLPIESLKRRGTIDQGASDPHIPASTLGKKDGYSSEFLETLDRGMALRIVERPASIKEWIEPLFKGQTSESAKSRREPASSARGNSVEKVKAWLSTTRNKAIAGAAALILSIGLILVLIPTPVDELIGEASAILAESPFVKENVDEARSGFLKIQLLDRATSLQISQADSGVRICDLISGYSDDIAEKSLSSAYDKLESIRRLDKSSQLDLLAADLIESSYNFESGLDKYSALLNRANLDEQFLSEGTRLLEQMEPGRGDDMRGQVATEIQEIVSNATSAFANKQFATALSLIDQAEEQANKLGYQSVSMEFSRDLVTTERRNYVLALNQQAVEELVSDGTNAESLSKAKTAFDEILRVDSGLQEASDGRDVVSRLTAVRNNILNNQPFDIVAQFSQLQPKAQSTGIQSGDWSEMQRSFHALAQTQSLRNQRLLLTENPLSVENLNTAAREYAEVVEQSRLLQLPQDVARQAPAGLSLITLLRSADSDTVSHRYAKALQDIQNAETLFNDLDDGEKIKAAAEAAINRRLGVETNARRSTLLSTLADYRLPNPSTDLKSKLTYFQAIVPADAQATRVNSMIELIDKMRADTNADNYPSIYEEWLEFKQLAESTNVPATFLEVNRAWLDEQTFAHGQSELNEAFNAFASRPFEATREERLKTAIENSNTLSLLAGQPNKTGESLSNALGLFEQVKTSLSLGAFNVAKSRRDQMAAALSVSDLELDIIASSLERELSKQQSGYVDSLTSRVRDNLNAGFASLRNKPLNDNRIKAFDDQLNELIEVKGNTQVEFDWSNVITAKACVDALKQSSSLAREGFNYRDASKQLAQISLEIQDGSRWKTVLKTAMTQLQRELTDKLDILSNDAAKALIAGRFDPQAWKIASEKYDEMRKLERSDSGVGKAGMDFIDLLKEVAGPFQRKDPAFILSGGNNFSDRSKVFTLVPSASAISNGIAKELDAAQKVYLAEASKQISAVFGDFKPPATTESVRSIRAELRTLETNANANQDLATSAMISNVYGMLDKIDSAFVAQQSRNYLAAKDNLDSVKSTVAYGQLNRTAQRNLTNCTREMLGKINSLTKSARRSNHLALMAGFDSLMLDPKNKSNLRDFQAEVQKALATQPDFEDAVVAKKISDQLNVLDGSGFSKNQNNCNVIKSIREDSARLKFQSFKLDWIDQIDQSVCL